MQLHAQRIGCFLSVHANEIPVQSRYGSGVRVMRLDKCHENIRHGESFDKALLLSGIFSQMYASWIAIGSRTGEMESILQLYKDGRIDKHTTISEAVNPEIMSKRLNLL